MVLQFLQQHVAHLVPGDYDVADSLEMRNTHVKVVIVIVVVCLEFLDVVFDNFKKAYNEMTLLDKVTHCVLYLFIVLHLV